MEIEAFARGANRARALPKGGLILPPAYSEISMVTASVRPVGFSNRQRKSQTSDLIGSPSRTRTYDLAINSRVLYQLSYRGTRGRV